MEKIVHNECGCSICNDPSDPKCLKRYFDLFDYRTGKDFRLFVCNNLIRLKINNKEFESGNRFNYSFNYSHHNDVIKDLVSEYVPYTNLADLYFRGGVNYNANDLIQRRLSVTICDRPYLSHQMSLIEAVDLYFNNKSIKLLEQIHSCFLEYINKSLYKKYKTKYATILKMIKKLDQSQYLDKENIINEIVLEILKFKIKTKNK